MVDKGIRKEITTIYLNYNIKLAAKKKLEEKGITNFSKYIERLIIEDLKL